MAQRRPSSRPSPMVIQSLHKRVSALLTRDQAAIIARPMRSTLLLLLSIWVVLPSCQQRDIAGCPELKGGYSPLIPTAAARRPGIPDVGARQAASLGLPLRQPLLLPSPKLTLDPADRAAAVTQWHRAWKFAALDQ